MTQSQAAVSDYTYPAFFHREQSPAWIAAVSAALGHGAPHAPQSICEIGCGQGFGLTLLAAANPDTQFLGLDLNADHIEIAQTRAEAAGLTNIRFLRADIKAPPKVAQAFDYILCHGMLAWVDAATRQALARFIAAHLAPQGLAALHYMSQPGGAAFSAFHMVFRALKDHPDPISEGLRQLVALREAKAGFFQLHPHASSTLDNLLRAPKGYVAHEFLGEVFEPLGFSDLHALLSGQGLSWRGSLTPIENIDAMSLPEATRAQIQGERNLVLRESLKDLARNQALRYDLFGAPAAPLAPEAHLAHLAQQVWAILPDAPSGESDLTFSTRIGAVTGDKAIFGPLIARLRQGPASFAELREIAPFTQAPGLLNQALQAGLWAGICLPKAPARDHKPAGRLNRLLLAAAARGEYIPALAAPSLGTALSVSNQTLELLSKKSAPVELVQLFALDE